MCFTLGRFFKHCFSYILWWNGIFFFFQYVDKFCQLLMSSHGSCYFHVKMWIYSSGKVPIYIYSNYKLSFIVLLSRNLDDCIILWSQICVISIYSHCRYLFWHSVVNSSIVYLIANDHINRIKQGFSLVYKVTWNYV